MTIIHGNRVSSAIGVVLVTCLGVRLADWAIAPLVPLLIVFGVLFAIGRLLLHR